MLIVLTGGPVATPLEASFGEEFEAEILMVDLVREVPRTVGVGLACDGLDENSTVFKRLDVRVVEGVDVDGQYCCRF